MGNQKQFDCETAFKRLDDYLDGELGSEEISLIRAHLGDCEVCAREFAFEGSLLEEIRQKINSVEVPSDLRSRVSALLNRAKSNERTP